MLENDLLDGVSKFVRCMSVVNLCVLVVGMIVIKSYIMYLTLAAVTMGWLILQSE